MTLPDKKISFGSGGGFTGIETAYILLENGQVFRRVGVEGKVEELKKINKTKAQECFDTYLTLKLPYIKLNQPGNVYYFLEYKNDTLANKLTWAGPGNAPQEVESFFNSLNNLVRTKKSSPSQQQQVHQQKVQ